jgi:hypothetical protein
MHFRIVMLSERDGVIRGAERELREIRRTKNPFQSNHGNL